MNGQGFDQKSASKNTSKDHWTTGHPVPKEVFGWEILISKRMVFGWESH